jgi:hypothetical protein
MEPKLWDYFCMISDVEVDQIMIKFKMNLQVILLKMFPGLPFLDLKGVIPGGSSCVPPLGVFGD